MLVTGRTPGKAWKWATEELEIPITQSQKGEVFEGYNNMEIWS